MAFRLNPLLDKENHHRVHYTELEYIELLEKRGRLLRIDNVAVDVEQMMLRTFQCDSGYCVRCNQKDGKTQYKGSCCTDLEVDLTPYEINQIKKLGAMAEERLELDERDPLRDVVKRIAGGKFVKKTEKGEWALDQLPTGRCKLSWLESGTTLRCGLNTLAGRLDLPLGQYKPDPCFLFPLHYVEYSPDQYLLTILCSETHTYVGCDKYVGKLRCLSKPQPGMRPVYQALQYEIILCLGDKFFGLLEEAARPIMQEAGLMAASAATETAREPEAALEAGGLMRAPREHVYSGLCHVCNAVPLWGLLFCGWIWFAQREESRTVVYNARQAMMFHVLLMLALLVYIALGFLARLLGQLSPTLGYYLPPLNDDIRDVFLIGYVSICLYGAVQCFMGQPFHYPFLGRRRSS